MVGRRKRVKRHYVPPPWVPFGSDSEPEQNLNTFPDNEPPTKRLREDEHDDELTRNQREDDTRENSERVK